MISAVNWPKAMRCNLKEKKGVKSVLRNDLCMDLFDIPQPHSDHRSIRKQTSRKAAKRTTRSHVSG